MASAASGPRRSSILVRPPSRSRRFEKNSNGGVKSALERQRFRLSEAGLNRAAVSAWARKAFHSEPLRPCAMTNRSSSEQLNSGPFSTLASARSSSGRVRKSPSASKSSTAICSVKAMRSEPATAMPRVFSAATIGTANGWRLRTRMRMSPARIGRPSLASVCFLSSQSPMVAAMRSAKRLAGARSLESESGFHGSAAVASLETSVGQISIVPDCPKRLAICSMVSDSAVRPGVFLASRKTSSMASRTGCTVRNDRLSGTRRHCTLAVSARLEKC